MNVSIKGTGKKKIPAQIISISVSALMGALIYIHWYPWLYNKINKYTKRGEDLHENIDFVNTMIMFTLPSILLFVLFFSMHLLYSSFHKLKK